MRSPQIRFLDQKVRLQRLLSANVGLTIHHNEATTGIPNPKTVARIALWTLLERVTPLRLLHSGPALLECGAS